MIWIILGCVLYVGMWVFTAGKEFAYWQIGWGKYINVEEDKRGDWFFSWFCAFLWWVDLPLLFFWRHPISKKRSISYGWTLNYKNPAGK